MTKQEPRWYRLWYVSAALSTITFCGSFFSHRRVANHTKVLHILAIISAFAAGIVNGKRYKQKQGISK